MAFKLSAGIFLGSVAINWLVGCFGEQSVSGPGTPVVGDRSRVFLAATFFIYAASFILGPAFVCGCHFSRVGLVVSIPALVWGYFPFFFYRSPRERVVGYIALVLAIAWLYRVWQTNLRFL